MGYTHYYYVEKVLDKEKFLLVVKDFVKMIPKLEHLGVKIADGMGRGKPEITESIISFNGSENCGHEKRDLGITWPSESARGVTNLSRQHREGNQTLADTDGHWFAGLKLNSRTCGGDCSHETFSLEQTLEIPEWKKSDTERYIGKYFECTKTAYKPYDLAVNVCLIIAKHYLGNQIIVRSDGEIKDWSDAMELCEHFLGYGSDFSLNEEPEKKIEEIKVKSVETEKDRSVKIGDVFYASWGYDQTNIDFVKVIGFTKSGKSAKVVSIGSKKVESISDMSEKIVPDPDKVISPEVSLRIQQDGVLRGSYYYCNDSKHLGWLWKHKDGDSHYQSHYA